MVDPRGRSVRLDRVLHCQNPVVHCIDANDQPQPHTTQRILMSLQSRRCVSHFSSTEPLVMPGVCYLRLRESEDTWLPCCMMSLQGNL